jgi:hypothetical protein
MTIRMTIGRWVAVFALACVVMIIVLNGKPEFSNASRPPRGIASPVVALEVARNVDEVDAIVGDAPSPDREAMRIKQYLDFAFIASYSSLYVALALLLRSRWATLAAVCGVAAGVFDVAENLGILRILDLPLRQTTQAMVDAIRYPSLTKWTLAFVATAIFGAIFLKSRPWSWKIIGALNMAAAVLGLYGVIENSFLVWAGIPMLIGLAGLILVFVRPHPRSR